MELVKVTLETGSEVYILPDRLESYKRYYAFNITTEAVENRCGYDIGAGWHPAKCGNPNPCPDHAHLKCWCGKQALNACSYAGSIGVCGNPICGDHELCNMHKSC
jgi:hypothetical protein